MKAVFRVDASLQIGLGHVMRCLTLASELKLRSCDVLFVTRDHPGNLIQFIAESGFDVQVLLCNERDLTEGLLTHSSWLGASVAQDEQQSIVAISTWLMDKGNKLDWLIVDHYGLDYHWEKIVSEEFGADTIVIDDLADRRHRCKFLIDQTLGRDVEDYQGLVSDSCRCLLGVSYALLRPEFVQWRERAILRRENIELRNILISLGGVDIDNVTIVILSALMKSALPKGCEITVVLGGSSPHLVSVRELASKMPLPTMVLVNIDNMAELMSNADLAIGAAGSTSWERCCLGLPTIIVILAENQRLIAQRLEEFGVAWQCSLGNLEENIPVLINRFVENEELLITMVNRAFKLTEGRGVQFVIDEILDSK